MCPGFLSRTAPWVGGSMKIPLTRILSKFPQGGGAGCVCVWGAGRGEKTMVPTTRAKAPAAYFRSAFSF